MRDYLAAVRDRVVVFDGGMGATLEEFDLTQEDYGGLEGKCHEALVLNRPDVIEDVHRSMVEAIEAAVSPSMLSFVEYCSTATSKRDSSSRSLSTS